MHPPESPKAEKLKAEKLKGFQVCISNFSVSAFQRFSVSAYLCILAIGLEPARIGPSAPGASVFETGAGVAGSRSEATNRCSKTVQQFQLEIGSELPRCQSPTPPLRPPFAR